MADMPTTVATTWTMLPTARPTAATMPPFVPCAIDLAITYKFEGPGDMFSIKAAAVNAIKTSGDGIRISLWF